MGVRLGMDVGGTKVNIGLFKEDGHLLYKERYPVQRGAGAGEFMQLLAARADELLLSNGLTRADVVSIGIGVPGTTDGHVVLNAPNLHWINEPCAEYFTLAFGKAPILAQDTRAAALGEYRLGAGQGKRVLICVTLGTGIGSGIIIDGHIFNGGMGTAGEVGHIPVVSDGRICNCGRRGCMEAYASGTGIFLSAKEDPYLHHRIDSAHDVFMLAQKNDPIARKIIAEAVAYCGRALCAVINTLSPDALIFSGGMSSQMGLYIAPLIAHIRASAYALAVGEALKIDVSPLGEDAPMIGAAMLGV